jgi:hypothetical protein
LRVAAGLIRKVFQKMPADAAARRATSRTGPSRRQADLSAPADLIEVFAARLATWAYRYAIGEIPIIDAVDGAWAAAEQIGVAKLGGTDCVQERMARVFGPLRDDLAADDQQAGDLGDDGDDHDHNDDDHGDEYVGERPELEDIPIVAIHGVASPARLQRQYEASIRHQRERYGPAESTLQTAEFLISGKRDISKLRAWLKGRSARDVAAIQEHIQQKRRKGGT